MLLYVLILYLDIDFFPATERTYRKWRSTECTQPSGRDVKQECESLYPPLRHPLPFSLRGFCFPPFILQTVSLSALTAQRKRWLRPGAQQGMARASEFPGEMFGLLGCSSEGLREGEQLWTVLSLPWHLHHEFSALQFTECFPETLTVLILPQAWEWILLVPSVYTLGNWGSVGIHS